MKVRVICRRPQMIVLFAVKLWQDTHVVTFTSVTPVEPATKSTPKIRSDNISLSLSSLTFKALIEFDNECI